MDGGTSIVSPFVYGTPARQIVLKHCRSADRSISRKICPAVGHWTRCAVLKPRVRAAALLYCRLFYWAVMTCAAETEHGQCPAFR